MNSKITKAILQGPAGAGKTSLKCLLLGQKYNKEHSTGLMEDPQIAVGRFASDASGKWTKVTYVELTEKAIAELQSKAQSLPTHDTSSSTSSGTIPVSNTSNNEQHSVESVVSDDDEDVKLVQELLNRASHENTGITVNALSLNQQWLYFTDSGGQIQFQKLIHGFLPAASVLVLVFSLADDFSSPSSTVLRREGREGVKLSDDSIPVEELLRQLVTMINSTVEELKEMIASSEILSEVITPPDELGVICVGTHRDVYNKKYNVESIEHKEKVLDDILTSLERQPLYENCQNIHEVDGRKAKEGNIDDEMVRKIGKELQNKAYTVDVPLKWYCFDILLHQIAEKKGKSVFELCRCKSLGGSLGMSEDEIISALKFFHILNTMLYYPDSSVKDLVFVQPQESIVAIIGDLVNKICEVRARERPLVGPVKDLVLKGEVSVKDLKQISDTCSSLSREFKGFESKLLCLFEELHIATKIQRDDCENYFIPALLPVIDLSKKGAPFHSFYPLCYYYKKGLPMGFFCKLIVRLQTDHCFDIITSETDPNYSNYITLGNDDSKHTFVFIEKLYWFEVYSESSNNNSAIREAVDIAIRAITHKLPEEAFECECKEVPYDHVAVVSNQSKCLVKCVVSNKRSKDGRCSLWFAG